VLAEAVRGTPFWTLTASSALGLLASSVLLAHPVAYLIGRGFGPVFAASAVGLLGLASLPGRYFINRFSERVSSQSLLAACCACQAVAAALLASAAGSAMVWAYVLLYGAAFGAISPLRASTMADQFGRRAYGAITAVQNLPVTFAAAAGPLAAGLLYDRLGSYSLALWLTVAAFAAAGLTTWLTPRPPPGSPASSPARASGAP